MNIYDWLSILAILVCLLLSFFFAGSETALMAFSRARMLRLRRLLRGDFREWNDLHVNALAQRSAVLTADSRQVLQAFARAREALLPWQRAAWLRRSGVFRQRPGEQLMLWAACLLRRM